MIQEKIFCKLKKQTGSQGFILPLVMIISLIITTGLMALAARSWLGLSGTIRQSQSRQAREIAEAGIATGATTPATASPKELQGVFIQAVTGRHV